jgi:hypothetical protein
MNCAPNGSGRHILRLVSATDYLVSARSWEEKERHNKNFQIYKFVGTSGD